MASEITLSLLIGPVQPNPAPREVMESLVSASVQVSATGKSGFDLSFAVSKGSPLLTDLLPTGYFDPPTRVILVATMGSSATVLMDGVITFQEMVPSDEPGKAVLTAPGKRRLDGAAEWLNGQKEQGSELLVATFAAPNQNADFAQTVTQKQSEVVMEYLRANHKVHQIGRWWWSTRTTRARGCAWESGYARTTCGTTTRTTTPSSASARRSGTSCSGRSGARSPSSGGTSRRERRAAATLIGL